MDVVLINPAVRKKGVGQKIDHKCTPLGLANLAGALRAGGFSVSIIDMIADDLSAEDAVARLVKEAPFLVGIGATSIGFSETILLARIIKGRLPECKIALGGFHVSSAPDEVVSKYGKIFDTVLVGEGELTFPMVARRISEGKMISKKTTCKMPDDLDALPMPAFDLLDFSKYSLPTTSKVPSYLEAGRGCPFSCSFCSIKKTRVRNKSPERIVREMRELSRRGVGFVEFSDEVFTLGRERVIGLCREIRKSDLKLDWGCQTRCDLVDPELLSEMRKAGCTLVSFGVESGSLRLRRKVGKGLAKETILRAFSDAKKAGLETGALFILGLPGETREEAEQTLALAIELSPSYCNFSPLILYPNTDLFAKALSESGSRAEKMWDNYFKGDGFPINFPEYCGSEREYFKFLSEINRRFYLRPEYVLQRISALRSFGDFIRNLKGIAPLLASPK